MPKTERFRSRVIELGFVALFALSAADMWYSDKAESAQKIVDMHDKRIDDYYSRWSKDSKSGDSNELGSMLSARESAASERDSLHRKSRVYDSASILALLAFLGTVWVADLVKRRKADPDGGSWIGDRNRALVIATSFTIFFGALLLAPGIGAVFQGFMNIIPMTLSDIRIPGLGQEVNGFFRPTPLGWIPIMAIIWLFSFVAGFPKESR
jgi:hypothetical protein